APFLYQPSVPDWRWLQWSAAALGLATLLSLGVLLIQGRYNRRLKAEIEQREAAQRELAASRADLLAASQLARLGHWQWDAQTDRHHWSPEIYAFYGRDPALGPAIYPEVKSYFTEESWARLAAAVEQCLYHGQPYVCDAEVVRPDGSHLHITARGMAEHDAAGTVVQLHGTVQDITERKRDEAELRESRARLATIIDLAPIGIALIGLDGRCVLANRALREFLELDEAALQSASCESFSHPDELATDRYLMAELLARRLPGTRREKRYLTRSGAEVRALQSVSLVWKQDGTPDYFVHVIEALTPRKAATLVGPADRVDISADPEAY
ncbi:MAG: hypothetical protein RJA44_1887, partial [Pseudomonadota bacterium]